MNLDIHSIIYGLLMGLCALLGVGYLTSDKKRKVAEAKARSAELITEVTKVEAHNETTPLDELTKEFDAELDADNTDKSNKPES